MFLKYLQQLSYRLLLFIIAVLKSIIVKPNQKGNITNDVQVKSKEDEIETHQIIPGENNLDHISNIDKPSPDFPSGENKKPEKNLVQTKLPLPIFKIPIGKNLIFPSIDNQRKVDHLFKNVKDNNVESMGNELREIIRKRELPWLINYIVLERITSEPDFHAVYLKLINYLNSDLFDEMIVSITIDIIKIMLKRRSRYEIFALQNLGKWLTLITLAEKRAVLIDANYLQNILCNVKKCTEEMLPKVGNKSKKKNIKLTFKHNRSRKVKLPPLSIFKIPSGQNIVLPPLKNQRTIEFLFNNMNHYNVEPKLREINEERYLPGLINYMVVERLATEPKSYGVYLRLVDNLNNIKFNKLVVSATIYQIKIMLNRRKKFETFVLRNLGKWLELFNLTRKRPKLVDSNELKNILKSIEKISKELEIRDVRTRHF